MIEDNYFKSYCLQIGDICEIYDINNQIDYTKQSDIEVGDNIFAFPNSLKQYHTKPHFIMYTQGGATFKIIEIKYKNKFYKIFKWFLKTPIEYIVVKYISCNNYKGVNYEKNND